MIFKEPLHLGDTIQLYTGDELIDARLTQILWLSRRCILGFAYTDKYGERCIYYLRSSRDEVIKNTNNVFDYLEVFADEKIK